MKFERGKIYLWTKTDLIVEITEISGPTVFFRVIKDLAETKYNTRVGTSGTIHGYHQEKDFKNYKHFNTPLWKAVNSV